MYNCHRTTYISRFFLQTCSGIFIHYSWNYSTFMTSCHPSSFLCLTLVSSSLLSLFCCAMFTVLHRNGRTSSSFWRWDLINCRCFGSCPAHNASWKCQSKNFESPQLHQLHQFCYACAVILISLIIIAGSFDANSTQLCLCWMLQIKAAV